MRKKRKTDTISGNEGRGREEERTLSNCPRFGKAILQRKWLNRKKIKLCAGESIGGRRGSRLWSLRR